MSTNLNWNYVNASESDVQISLRDKIEKHLDQLGYFAPEWFMPMDVTEGTEKCGYGNLLVSGEVSAIVMGSGGKIRHKFRVKNNNSQWKIIGTPTRTIYEVRASLMGC